MSKVKWTYTGTVGLRSENDTNGNNPTINVCEDLSACVVCEDDTAYQTVVKKIKQAIYDKLSHYNDWISGGYDRVVINEFNLSMEKISIKKKYYIHGDPVYIVSENATSSIDDPKYYLIAKCVYKLYLIEADVHTNMPNDIEINRAVFHQFIKKISSDIIFEYCQSIGSTAYSAAYHIAIDYKEFKEISEQEAEEYRNEKCIVAKPYELKLEV